MEGNCLMVSGSSTVKPGGSESKEERQTDGHLTKLLFVHIWYSNELVALESLVEVKCHFALCLLVNCIH